MNFGHFIEEGIISPSADPAISIALLAYAAGDAVGAEYEFLAKPYIVQLDRLGAKPNWPFGGISDDTALTILTIQAFGEYSKDKKKNLEELFLTRLRESVPRLRGLGPTTRSVLGLPVGEKETHEVGKSNGALMRTALLGMAWPGNFFEAQRRTVLELAQATHKDPSSGQVAVIGAELFGSSLGSACAFTLYEIVERSIQQIPNCSAEIKRAFESPGEWEPPIAGISNNAIETLQAVCYVAASVSTCFDAYQLACLLGGDTDTVAALSAALVTLRYPHSANLLAIPWLKDVKWDEIPDLKGCAEILSKEHPAQMDTVRL